MNRQELSDSVWARIEPHLPGKESDPGRSGRDNRLFVEAILWLARSGAHWRVLPELISLMEAMPDQLSEGLKQRFGRVEAKLQLIENFAAQRRYIHNFVLGRDLVLEWKFLSIFIILGLFIGSVFTVLVASNIPPVARHVASRLIADIPQFCRTIAIRFAVDDCAVPEAQRKNALAALPRKNLPPHKPSHRQPESWARMKPPMAATN